MLPVFITCGDPNGIGPEVTLKALAILPEKIKRNVILAGPFQMLITLNRLLGEPLQLVRVESIRDFASGAVLPVLELEGARGYRPSYGRVTAQAGMIAGRGIMYGAAACTSGEAAALVTAPVSKEAMHLAGFQYPGQTEMLAKLTGSQRYIMILFGGRLRIGLATTHVALRDVPRLLQRDLVLEKILTLRDTLRERFSLPRPRLAVSALNPHASDGGIFGFEEERVLRPAIADAQGRGLDVEGPFPADTLFPRWRNYDGLLAMYHDQGMIPLKMAAFGKAVNLTGGLPFIRTSPDHGTAFDLAGKLIADPKSMARAIRAAFDLTARAG